MATRLGEHGAHLVCLVVSLVVEGCCSLIVEFACLVEIAQQWEAITGEVDTPGSEVAVGEAEGVKLLHCCCYQHEEAADELFATQMFRPPEQ